ncbi:MAG: hypothetical protein FGM55_01870 [Rhodoferax sp.]|nr:hypothetical protein [Rhodoferax sp.]
MRGPPGAGGHRDPRQLYLAFMQRHGRLTWQAHSLGVSAPRWLADLLKGPIVKKLTLPLLLTLALGAGLAQAQMDRPAMGAGHGHDPARMQARIERHAADLKERLKITPAQEPAWTAFVGAMKPPMAGTMPQRGELEKLSTPERLDRMKTMRQQHQAAADQRDQATRALYATLTPDQKKVFDDRTARHHRAGGMRLHEGAPKG